MIGCPSISDDNIILAHFAGRDSDAKYESQKNWRASRYKSPTMDFKEVGRIAFSYFRGALVALLRRPNDKRWIGDGPCLRSSSMCALVG